MNTTIEEIGIYELNYLPEHIEEFGNQHEFWKYNEDKEFDYLLCNKTPDTCTKFALITSVDGGFYKVNARFMVWTNQLVDFDGTPTNVCKAVWSSQSLSEAVGFYMEHNSLLEWRDREYQT